jgi:hypothetical protein
MKNVEDFKNLVSEAVESPKGSPKGKVPVEKDKAVTGSTDSVYDALDSVSTSIALSGLERKILEGVLIGTPISQLSYSLGIPENHIRTFLVRPKVKEYLKEVREAMIEMDQLMLTDALRRIVSDRISKLEDPTDFSGLSQKDTLDIIKVFMESNVNTQKAKEASKETNVFTAIYQQVMGS